MRVHVRQMGRPFSRGMDALGMTDARARECMGYGELRCTPEEIEQARALLYAAETEEGLLVSREQVEAGQYRIAEDYAEPTQIAVGPAPEELPLPLLYLAQDCSMPGGGLPPPECSYQNGARLAANVAIIANWRNANARNRCLYENQLNAGHPNVQRNCNAPEYMPEPVPSAVGIMEQAIRMGGSIVPPRVAPGHFTGSGAVVSGGAAPTEAPVYEPPQEVMPGRVERAAYATPLPVEPMGPEPAGPSYYEQIAGGFEEAAGGAAEATGLSRNTLLLIAAVVGGYLLLK